MKRISIGENKKLAAVLVAVLFFAMLSISFAFAGTAHAQRAQQLGEAQAGEVADPRPPRDPVPPFGYGGGPREPRDPDLTPRLGDIFDRIREFVLRLFR